MEILTLFALALGLSFDTFAVSLSCGVLKSEIRFRQALKVAVLMAVFQGGLPVVGYYIGSAFSDYIEKFDHWIAFGLLFILGARMIYEGLKTDKTYTQINIDRPLVLLTLAVGTSIDAFVVGIGIGFLGANIWISAITIFTITLLASMTAIKIGKKAGPLFGNRVEIAGGVILILIGIKILIEHLMV